MIKIIFMILEITILLVALKFFVDTPRNLESINQNLTQINQTIQEQNKIFGFNPNETEERCKKNDMQ